MRDRTGVAPQASRLLACRKGGCVTARDKPPSCLRQGRGLRHVSWVRIREGAWKPILLARLAAGRSCPLFKLVATPREGAVPPSNPLKGGSAPWPPERGCVAARDRPPSCVPQGRKFRSCSYAETRECALRTHTARALASGPWREIKFFAKLSSKESGGEKCMFTTGNELICKMAVRGKRTGGSAFFVETSRNLRENCSKYTTKTGKNPGFSQNSRKRGDAFSPGEMYVKCLWTKCGKEICP